MLNELPAVLLDTSFISALYKPGDSQHLKALEIYKEQVAQHEVFVPITVLLELSVMMPAYLEAETFYKFLQALNYKTCYLDIFFETEFNSFQKKTTGMKLKTMDLSVLLCALSSDSELITLDTQLQKVWNKLPEMSPYNPVSTAKAA
jgi:predicted nucleic acid-binding protein